MFTSKNYFAGTLTLIVFAVIMFAQANAALYSRECEDYNSVAWGGTGVPSQVRVESHSLASDGLTLHLGPDWSPNDTYGVNDEAVYAVTLEDYNNASISISYSDDVAGNVIRIYLDDVEKCQFKTFFTGGWNTFKSTNRIPLGAIAAGQHTIKFKVAAGGSYGLNLDIFEIRELQTSSSDPVSFIKNLVDSNTGLVRSREDETFTTVYKNSLAAMVFVNQGDMNRARGIFNFFKDVYDNTQDFAGFTKEWNASTGAALDLNYWEGDNSFLLIALNYYEKASGGIGDYSQMRDSLIDWLAERGNDCNEMIPEGAADMYAALAPFAGDDYIDSALIKLKARYYNSVAYATALDHTHRGSLIFGDLDGFNYADNFYFPNETWDYDDVTVVSAYEAFPGENFSNLEISAQLLNAWGIFSNDLTLDLANLENELEKLWLNGQHDSNSRGLPYYVQNVQFENACSLPMIDPTAFMLFYYWNFNPCVPGEKFVQIYECEDYNSVLWGGAGDPGQIRLESKTAAFNGQGLHIGPDWSPDNSYGINDEAEYVIDLQENYNTAAVRIRYADDVAGNVIKVFLDNVEKGEFETSYTNGWNNFVWTDSISLGSINAGKHLLKFKVATGGSYGLILDVFKIARQNIVHFDMQYLQREQANYSGAACIKMALDREDANNSFTQSGLHSYGISHNSAVNLNGTYIDPQGMSLTLNDNELDIDYNYSWTSSTTINDAFHDICYWIEYDIIGAYPQNMPAAIPLGGNYENWVLVNGFNASDNPWQTSTYTVYGFWITDPSASGIGENVYKTASELANDYIALSTGDGWNGKYVSVCEPPQTQAQVTIAIPAKFKEKLSSNKDIIDAAIKGLQDNILKSDTNMEIAFIGSSPAKPIKVKKQNGSYFIVPFLKDGGCCIAVIVDAADGTFKQAAFSKTPDLNYLKRFAKTNKTYKFQKGKNAFLPQISD
ncbi:MAG: hypothetical protein A2Y10_15450 [Planctomycetes bacterium GWF2_41_51]|nr:MAG: hypothetical protein A2Y10_15450 [Planctomycetes bacterium GWF2_41_51]HBG27568.1 hypothetical protein [Phycisphaerales bacterium]